MHRRDEGVPSESFGHWALGTGHWALGTGHWGDPGTSSHPSSRTDVAARNLDRNKKSAVLVAFHVHDLVEREQDGCELRRVGHHLVIRLIVRRNVDEERPSAPIFDAKRLSTLLVNDGNTSRTPRVVPVGTVRVRLERDRIGESFHDTQRSVHRARNHTELPPLRRERSRPLEPDTFTETSLLLSEVVVTS